MPSLEIMEIQFADVFRYANYQWNPDWVVINPKSDLNPQFFFACPIQQTPDGKEMLGLPSTESVETIAYITERWDSERVFAALELGWKYNFPSLSDERIREIINRYREQAQKPPNLLER